MSGYQREKYVHSLFDDYYCCYYLNSCSYCKKEYCNNPCICCGCNNPFHRDLCGCFEEKCCEHKKNDSNTPLVQDEFSGNISSPCDGTRTILWQSNIPTTFGTVDIFYREGCSSMNVFVNNKLAFTMDSGQTRSITLPHLTNVAVQCMGGTGLCSGKYCIELHYEKPSW